MIDRVLSRALFGSLAPDVALAEIRSLRLLLKFRAAPDELTTSREDDDAFQTSIVLDAARGCRAVAHHWEPRSPTRDRDDAGRLLQSLTALDALLEARRDGRLDDAAKIEEVLDGVLRRNFTAAQALDLFGAITERRRAIQDLQAAAGQQA